MKDVKHIQWVFDNLRNVGVTEIAFFRTFYEESESRAHFIFWNFIHNVTTCPGETLFCAEMLLENMRYNGNPAGSKPGQEDRPIPCPACSRS